ncbi:MAG: hypothetical protein LBK58_07385 [Prevotellaceae bacterium]|jgi:hypothetical protein|nr:hypothetical protein [Prevotellaceae bacterium]
MKRFIQTEFIIMMKMNKNVLLPDLEYAYDEFTEFLCTECTAMDSMAYCNALVYTRVELASCYVVI